MAATLGTLPVKILAQVGDGEPIEIGTYDIPISVGEQKPAVYRDGGDVFVQADMKGYAEEVAQAAENLARRTFIAKGAYMA